MHAELAATECNEANVDQRCHVARLAHGDAVLRVLGAAHQRWPVVLEAVSENGEDDRTERRYHRAAAGCGE